MLILRNSGSFSACNIITFVSCVLKPNVRLVRSLVIFPLLLNSISLFNPLKTAFAIPTAGRKVKQIVNFIHCILALPDVCTGCLTSRTVLVVIRLCIIQRLLLSLFYKRVTQDLQRMSNLVIKKKVTKLEGQTCLIVIPELNSYLSFHFKSPGMPIIDFHRFELGKS